MSHPETQHKVAMYNIYTDMSTAKETTTRE